jgi:hypothetical protein
MIAAVLSGLVMSATAARSDEANVAEVKKYLEAKVMPWLKEKIVIDSIKAQNAKHAALTQNDIDRLDKQWRGEVDAAQKPLIDVVMKNELSAFLKKKKEEAKGLLTEIFVMDDKGLNVGQSDVTSDYWQGDEAKWQKTFLVGPDAVFVDKIEKDESTQELQTQISVTIKDPESGKPIGAITLGISIDRLSS